MPKLFSEAVINITSESDFNFIKSNYSREQKIRFICLDCKCEVISRIDKKQYPLYCGKCKIKRTTFEHFGVTCSLQIQEIKEKSIKAAHTEEANRKRAAHINYNAAKDKTKITNLKKYGVEYTFQTENNKRKTRETCLRKYGVSWTSQIEKAKEKSKETCNKVYGVPYSFQSENNKIKSKETLKRKYGVENSMQSAEVLRKSRCRYRFDNLYFDSSEEICFYIMLKLSDIKFDYKPNINIKYLDSHYYHPDFMINNTLYEIKGDQFFENGKMIDFYNNHKNDFIYEAKYNCMKDNNVIIILASRLHNIKYQIKLAYPNFFRDLKNNKNIVFFNFDFSMLSYSIDSFITC